MTWREWSGGSMPVSPDSMVRPQIRALSRTDAEKRAPTAAKGWIWRHNGGPGDVVAFEQIGERA